MPSLDDEIDALYQQPLSQFVAARTALAKRAGGSAAAIKALQKPNAAAWAVNQLFWKHRPAFDRLIQAAKKLRAAQTRRLSGADVAIKPLEQAHAEVLKVALEATRALLLASGDSATPSTLTAVTETLQALPSEDTPGRLVRPLKPLGFAALARMLPKGSGLVLAPPAPPRSARTEPKPETRPPAKSGVEGKRAKARAAREREMARREAAERAAALRSAKAAERTARADAARAGRKLTATRQRHEQLTRQVQALSDEIAQLAEDYRKREEAARAAADRVAALQVRHDAH